MVIDERTNELLKEANSTAHGQAVIRFLNAYKEDLNNIKTVQSWDEALGRKYAIKFVDDLLSFMGEKTVETKRKNIYS